MTTSPASSPPGARVPAEPTPRRRGRPGHDQAAVLRAAVDLFTRKGYDATTTESFTDRLRWNAAYYRLGAGLPGVR